MSLDDGATNREPNPHAVALGGVKGIKKMIDGGRVDADARVFDRDRCAARVGFRGDDVNFSTVVPHGIDCIYCINEKVGLIDSWCMLQAAALRRMPLRQ